jgi:protein-tyrosine phosphatase
MELGLQSEKRLCEQNNIQFFQFPIKDRSVPSSIIETLTFIRPLVEQLQNGKHLAIHCRAGIGRSALIVAGVMVSAGESVNKVFELISKARGLSVPDTEEQIEWLSKFYQKLYNDLPDAKPTCWFRECPKPLYGTTSKECKEEI